MGRGRYNSLTWVIRPPAVYVPAGLAGLLAPVSGPISSAFGLRDQPTAGASTDHKGIDYAVPVGTSVVASAGGTVIFAGVQSGYGNVVQVNHGGGLISTYAHLSQIAVQQGQTVAAGQLLGYSGATGTVTGPNLHFGLTLNGVAVDPMAYLGGATPAPAAEPAAAPAGSDWLDLGLDPAAFSGVDSTAIAVLAGGLVGLAVLGFVLS